MKNELLERVEKAQIAYDKAAALLAAYESQFEHARLVCAPAEFSLAVARLSQQKEIVSACSSKRDVALAELNAAQTAEAEREQRTRDEQELADLNVRARALSAKIDKLNAEARAIPARLQTTHGQHTQTVKRIAELQAKLAPAPVPQMATWYSTEGSLANRLTEVLQ
ncbi:MAG TPA: hypothetical protein VMX38_06785 [Verrucomicrobiae bacterium]|nr:hypothetical protein [Verrucomicrobiae bacterium]